MGANRPGGSRFVTFSRSCSEMVAGSGAAAQVQRFDTGTFMLGSGGVMRWQ